MLYLGAVLCLHWYVYVVNYTNQPTNQHTNHTNQPTNILTKFGISGYESMTRNLFFSWRVQQINPSQNDMKK